MEQKFKSDLTKCRFEFLMKLQSRCLHLKMWPWLEDPLPGWFTHMAATCFLAVCGMPQFLTMWTSCAAWIISWRAIGFLQCRWSKSIQDGNCNVFYGLALESDWTHSTGHVGQPWFNVGGFCLRMLNAQLLRAFWRLAIRKILHLKIWNSTVCVYMFVSCHLLHIYHGSRIEINA